MVWNHSVLARGAVTTTDDALELGVHVLHFGTPGSSSSPNM